MPARPSFWPARWPSRIETERLVLRPLDESDLPVLVREIGRWDVARWLINVPHPYTEAHGRDWIARTRDRAAAGTLLHFVAEPKAGGAMLGAIGLMMDDPGSGQGELGYWYAADSWGQGYGTEAARALLRVAFRDLKLLAVTAAADPRNRGSNRVLEKAGFRLERIDPAHDMGLRGPPGPANLLRITRTDWEAKHGDE